MALANLWSGSGKKVHGIRVSRWRNLEDYYSRLDNVLKDLGLDLKAKDILTIYG